ncbi:conserved hypothetical protein [Desulforamulus reducens MI-1]|uniref:Uncharacterized protein n=1 Tax=Desulforamulus reducens (strain ATCC BAA-1160 / DSM 100696 / MI-1) TaxID=349161 RepID=A4J1H1_DESRM|nr:hypothetical protein [Desulforamulus reducens]ABO48924.1 conserved hypothetical protein [Desulforamulus reducens MI-1]
MARYRNDLEEALSKISEKKRKYFRFKFNIPFQGRPMKQTTLEEICKYIGVRNLQYFDDWEATDEYKNLVNIYLNSKTANDLLEIYNSVSEKAKQGDAKAIDTLLKLQKEIQANIKSAKRKEKDIADDDGLEL